VLDRISLRRTIATMAGVAAASSLVLLSLSSASGAMQPKSTVSGFTATGSSSEEESASPLVFYNPGGQILLTADVSNATSCVFSSNRPVAGLPVTYPCSNGVTAASATLPANAGRRDVTYNFHLKVLGRGTARATPQIVTVSSQPIPPYPPNCIEVGSTWDFSIPELPQLSFQETFVSGSTFTSTSGVPVFGGGTYSVVNGVLDETFAEDGQVTATWNGSEYFGLIDLPDLGESGFAVEPTGSLPPGC
jgi:hypothetical protein